MLYQPRHKMYSIKEVVKEKKEWCKKFDDYPYDYWKRRWDYLCRRLANYSDMQRTLTHNRHPRVESKKENKS